MPPMPWLESKSAAERYIFSEVMLRWQSCRWHCNKKKLLQYCKDSASLLTMFH